MTGTACIHVYVQLYMCISPQKFVSSAAVGSIVGMQSAEIQQMVSEYEVKVHT